MKKEARRLEHVRTSQHSVRLATLAALACIWIVRIPGNREEVLPFLLAPAALLVVLALMFDLLLSLVVVFSRTSLSDQSDDSVSTVDVAPAKGGLLDWLGFVLLLFQAAATFAGYAFVVLFLVDALLHNRPPAVFAYPER